MITPPGTRSADHVPERSDWGAISLSYEERPDGRVRVWAWATGSDGSRCTREAFLDACVARAYPELVEHTAYQVAWGVRTELDEAGLWHPPSIASF